MKKIGAGFRFFVFRFLLPLCGFFTLFTLPMLLFSDSGVLPRDKALILLFAAAGVALINLVFDLPKINVYFKIATHFISLMLLLLAVLWMSGFMQSGNWVLILIGTALSYAIVCPVVLLIRYAGKRREREEKKEDYTPRYK